MSLSNLLIKRVLYVVSTLIGASIVVFVLFNVAGNDPVITLGGKYCTAARAAAIRHQLGLDKSWFLQYLDVLKSFFTFSFGRSWHTKQHIGNMIREGGLVSLTITIPGFVFTNLISVFLSLYAAYHRGKLIDRLLVVSSILMMSVSVLSYILFAQGIFAYQLGWFPISGYEYGFPYFIPYVVLPCLIFVMLSIGHDVRFYRTIILDQLYQDYVRTAKAKGLSNFSLLFGHVLQNAMIPIITNMVIKIPRLMLGTILIESFFAIPGLGKLFIDAVHNGDFPVIKAVTILLSVSYMFFTFFADILYTIIDPRVRLD